MRRVINGWNSLALWLRWAIVGMPLGLSFFLHGYLGNHVVWIAVPGGLLVVLHVFMTWDDIGDALRAHVRYPF